MRKILGAMLAAAMLMAAMPAAAEPADVAGAFAMDDRAEQDTALDESRQPVAVLGFLGLEYGDVALDVMAGGGYYSELMARAVGPEGFVLAHNPPGVVSQFNIEQIFAGRGIGVDRVPNAASLPLAFDDFVLPPESVDFALFHMVFHDLWHEAESLPRTEPEPFLARLYAAMRPGAIVGIVDHVGPAGVDTRAEVAETHRIDPTVIRQVMENAGFVFEEELSLLRNPDDDHEASVFDPAIRGQTDRVVYRFRRPGRGD